MRWDRGHVSSDVEDRRGQGPARAGMGIFGLLPFFARFGWKGMVVFGLLAGGMYFASGRVTEQKGAVGNAGQEEMVEFVGFVLDDVQDTWSQLLTREGGYEKAGLVLFRGAVTSGCGMGESQMGPFYCPLDRKAYVDLSFFEDLHQRFGAPGDFAQAYVIAHEIGHHVQTLKGTSDKVRQAPAHAQKGSDGLSVKLELQADCFAGVWAYSAAKRQLLEVGDLEEALAAAAAIGDDRLQKQAKGRVTPETWSHGSSEQRAQWFQRGYKTGDPRQCDTFAAN